MYVLIYDGSSSCNDIKRFLESNNIPYRQIVDEDFRNSILECKTLKDLKEYKVAYKYSSASDFERIKGKDKVENIVMDKSNFVIIFHIGWALNHNHNEINAVCEKILVELKESKLKLGVSEGGAKYTEACKDYFDWTGDFGQCLRIMQKALSDVKEYSLQDKINCIIEGFKAKKREKTTEELSNTLLHLFLPLDIDMQALKILLEGTEEKQIKKTEQERNEEAVKYLKSMLNESKEYHKRILNNAHELLNQIPEDKKEKVQTLFEAIKPSLDTLGNLQQEKISEKEFFNNDQNKKLKENIKSFHDWYREIAKCLRGEEAKDK